MRLTIDLDDQTFGRAEKVDDSVTDHGLTAKLVTTQATAA
ncbi:hypothetical protein FHR91_002207 [Erythrobacter lutimaris]|nr:hypothetical protein [Alteriqipengyuania lutimaris]